MQDFNRLQTYPPSRLNLIWILLVLLFIAICLRLFYLQIVRHDEFLAQADAIQIKSLTIEAERGRIYAYNDGRQVPLVVNQRRWTMFSDTALIEDLPGLTKALRDAGVELTPAHLDGLASDSRYVVLQKEVTDERKGELTEQLTDYKGVYFQQQSIRQYLEGALASHALGFLNADSEGQYGIEQYYDQELTGTPGRLRATTDVRDVPLLSAKGNVLIEPQAGRDVVLTLDVALQRIVETQLAEGIAEFNAKKGTILVMDADTGAVLAMANYPDFDPANYRLADIADYPNAAVESVSEPASVMKVFLMASALDRGVVDIDDSYYNPLFQLVGGRAISNFIHRDEGYLPVRDILPKSLNTGTVEMLKRLGDGPTDEIDVTDRQVLYRYYTDAFRLGQKTGIGLPNEVAGFVNPPDYPWSPNHLYATMTFGQSISVTPIQLTAAYASVFNGGTYYRPYIVSQLGEEVRQPEILAEDILDRQAILNLRSLMVDISNRSLPDIQREGLEISAKTGTSQIPDLEEGGYIEDAVNGLMVGYIKSANQTMVIAVILEEPEVRLAGFYAAGPVWQGIVKNIIAKGLIIP